MNKLRPDLRRRTFRPIIAGSLMMRFSLIPSLSLVVACLIVCGCDQAEDPVAVISPTPTPAAIAPTPESSPEPTATPVPTPVEAEATPEPTPEPESSAIDRVIQDPELTSAREDFIARARRDAELPIIRRPNTIQELRDSRIGMKYREKPAHMSELDEATWEQVALSLGDIHAGSQLATELPRIAASYRLTGDASLKQRAVDQLAELATWEPLQREGYSLRNDKPVMPPEGEGAWLGTGWLIRTIAETLDYIPLDELPEDVRDAVVARLDAEIDGIVDDWETERPWYVRDQAVHSNQWVVPTEGLIRATLVVGNDKRPDAYELGVKNLTKSLDFQGTKGEYVEGLNYAALTLTSILSATKAMGDAGDTRALEHPFLENFPTWFAHHIQPGGHLINAFNSGTTTIDATNMQNLLARFATTTGNPVALWVLHTRAGFGDTMEGMLARVAPWDPELEPPLYEDYPLATRVNWRSSWDDSGATGFWMRGGHESDFHDHMDRGHVNFIIGDRPILIEAGTPSYGLPNFPTHFHSVAGHNVLQVGTQPPDELTPRVLRRAGQILEGTHRNAPFTVHHMDASGGSVTVDASAAYSEVRNWERRADWDAESLRVNDSVTLRRPTEVLFRWHLGAEPDAEAVIEPGLVRVGDIEMRYESDSPVTITIETMPHGRGHNQPVHDHACVVVRSAEPVSTLTMRTEFSLAGSE